MADSHPTLFDGDDGDEDDPTPTGPDADAEPDVEPDADPIDPDEYPAIKSVSAFLASVPTVTYTSSSMPITWGSPHSNPIYDMAIVAERIAYPIVTPVTTSSPTSPPTPSTPHFIPESLWMDTILEKTGVSVKVADYLVVFYYQATAYTKKSQSSAYSDLDEKMIKFLSRDLMSAWRDEGFPPIEPPVFTVLHHPSHDLYTYRAWARRLVAYDSAWGRVWRPKT